MKRAVLEFMKVPKEVSSGTLFFSLDGWSIAVSMIFYITGWTKVGLVHLSSVSKPADSSELESIAAPEISEAFEVCQGPLYTLNSVTIPSDSDVWHLIRGLEFLECFGPQYGISWFGYGQNEINHSYDLMVSMPDIPRSQLIASSLKGR